MHSLHIVIKLSQFRNRNDEILELKTSSLNKATVGQTISRLKEVTTGNL